MADSFTETCYQLLTRHLPEHARLHAQERLRSHPHFSVLRDCLAAHDVVPVPAEARAVLVETPDGCLLLPAHDAVQLPIIARYGSFQRDDLLTALAWLEARNAISGDVFVDVGANVGSHTLHAMRSGRFRRGLAVEPCPANARLLAFNMRLNGLAEQVDICACALASFEGTADLLVNPLNCGDARLAPVEAPPRTMLGEDDFDHVEVPVLTFDALVTSVNLGPSDLGLVWMDAQGSEGHILAEAHALRATSTPVWVEFWPYGMKALNSYVPLKAFVEAHCSAVVTFEGGVPREHPTTVLDTLFSCYEADERFIDLLLVR